MDAGYFSENNVLGLLSLKIDPFIALGRTKHGLSTPAHRGPLPKAMTIKDFMAYRLGTPGRLGHRPPTKGHRRAGLRADQRSSPLSPFQPARYPQGAR